MHWLWLTALLTGAFTLATTVEPRLRQWSQRKSTSESFLATVMGDSRRLFANHFFIQSDVYLHSGYYPGIFDGRDEFPNAAAQRAGAVPTEKHDDEGESKHEHDEQCDHDFLGKPRNWIDSFGRNFFPSKHTHLGAGPASAAEIREILPWMRLSAELDPQRVESYTVGAFWLRQMNKSDEAFQFLREGLRQNPDSCEIMFELGRSYEDRGDVERARNLWELALRRWQEQSAKQEEPDKFMGVQILNYLTRLEVRAGRREAGVGYLETLKKITPNPQEVQKRIDEVRAGQPFENDAKK